MQGNGVDRAVLFTDGNVGTVTENWISGFNNGVTATLISFNDPSATAMIANNTIENCDNPIHASTGRVVIRGNRILYPFSWRAIECGRARATIEGNQILGSPTRSLGSGQTRTAAAKDNLVVLESIALDFCPEFTIRNNIIVGGGTGIWLNNEDDSSLAWPWGVVENNTCFGLERHGIGCNRPNVLVRNNIVASSGRFAAPVTAVKDSVRFGYNLLWDYLIPPDWDTTLTKDNLFAAPMFADTLDFLLQAYSPAIDAGDPSILDADGSRSDIGYTGGPGGFTYPYQDLPPAPPHGLTATPTDSTIALLWRGNHDADLNHYNLYRDTLPIALAGPALLYAVIATDSTYTDTSVAAGQTYYYRLTALDNHMNTSGLSSEVSVLASGISSGDPITPSAFVLYPNYPNPFNASTTIRYALDRPGRVELAVYDVLGRHVATLTDAVQGAGVHRVTWGADGVASGVYFIVLSANDRHMTRKALLLK